MVQNIWKCSNKNSIFLSQQGWEFFTLFLTFLIKYYQDLSYYHPIIQSNYSMSAIVEKLLSRWWQCIPLIPLFWTSGDIWVCKARVDPLVWLICRLHAMDSSDSPLVQHLLTSYGGGLHPYHCRYGGYLDVSVSDVRLYQTKSIINRYNYA